MNPPDFQRIVVIGTSCSGKTTFAQRLAVSLRYPHIELDALHWKPNWVERPADEFRLLVAKAVSGDEWVVDGNYGKVRDLVWFRATSIVWLNYRFATVLSRALRRTFRRALTGEELYSGNKETLRKALFDRDSILLWVITTFNRRRRDYEELQKTNAFPQLRWFEFQTPADAHEFLMRVDSFNKDRMPVNR